MHGEGWVSRQRGGGPCPFAAPLHVVAPEGAGEVPAEAAALWISRRCEPLRSKCRKSRDPGVAHQRKPAEVASGLPAWVRASSEARTETMRGRGSWGRGPLRVRRQRGVLPLRGVGVEDRGRLKKGGGIADSMVVSSPILRGRQGGRRPREDTARKCWGSGHRRLTCLHLGTAPVQPGAARILSRSVPATADCLPSCAAEAGAVNPLTCCVPRRRRTPVLRQLPCTLPARPLVELVKIGEAPGHRHGRRPSRDPPSTAPGSHARSSRWSSRRPPKSGARRACRGSPRGRELDGRFGSEPPPTLASSTVRNARDRESGGRTNPLVPLSAAPMRSNRECRPIPSSAGGKHRHRTSSGREALPAHPAQPQDRAEGQEKYRAAR